MSFLVDTSVWSLAFRRKTIAEDAYSKVLRELIESGQDIFLIGIILQEILQGIARPEQFESLRKLLSVYTLIEPDRKDYEDAANLRNLCRRKGVQASSIDFLIATVAINHKCYLLSSDGDFENIATQCDLKLVHKGALR